MSVSNQPLTKAELTDALIVNLNMEKKEASHLVSFFYEELVSAFEQGESVHLSGLGNFDVKTKKARVGRNPKTKEEFAITARKVVTFHAGKKLKDEIKN